MSQASLLQFQRETAADIARTNRYPRGALKVLEVLRAARGAWVEVLDLVLLSNQINITARISELKRDMKYPVEWNGRPGHESAYRLVE